MPLAILEKHAKPKKASPIRLVVTISLDPVRNTVGSLPAEDRSRAFMAYLNEQKRQVREVLAERLHAECGEDYPTAPNLIFSVPASAFEQKPEPLSLLSIPGLPPGVTVRVDGLVRAHR